MIQGSVKSAVNEKGRALYYVQYTPSGKPVFTESAATKNVLENAASYGMNVCFNGKLFDAISSSYNYGYRDYNTADGRFSTVDPARDGENWYLYCKSDPVNFVDPYGLNVVLPKMNDFMQAYDSNWDRDAKKGTVLLGNSSDSYVYNSGCYLNFVTGTTNTINGTNYDLTVLNAQKDLFCKDYPDQVNTDAFCEKYKIKFDFWTKEKSGEVVIKTKIDEYSKSSTDYVLAAKVHYHRTSETATHWVGLGSNVVTIGEKDYVEIVGTSNQDTYTNVKTHLSRPDWWLAQDEKVYIPVNELLEIRAFWKDTAAKKNK